MPSYLGTTFVNGESPFFLAQATDEVFKLDPNAPWNILSSWSVAGADKAADGGVMDSYADPDSVAVAAGNKAYVLRYTRTKIVTLDLTQVVDGGAPAKTIDLATAAGHEGHGRRAGDDGRVLSRGPPAPLRAPRKRRPSSVRSADLRAHLLGPLQQPHRDRHERPTRS